MTEPNSKDNREALEDLTPEEIPEDNGPDLDNGPDAPGTIEEKLKNIFARIARGIEEYQRVFLQSQQWETLQKIFPGITEEQGINISFIADDIIEYLPEIQEAIKERKKETGKPITITDMLAGIEFLNEEMDQPGPCLLEDLLEAAQELRRSKTPSVTIKKVNEILFPLDKINSKLRLLPGKAFSEKPVYFEMANDKDKAAGIQLLVPVSMDFEKLKQQGINFSQPLNAFDQRVMQAIGAIFRQSGPIMTARQIYYAMGGTSKHPTTKQLDKIRESVIKMMGIIITINNRKEAERYNYPLFTRRFPILPAEIITAEINGNNVKDAIRLYTYPPLLEFSEERGQIEPINIKYLQNDIKKSKYYYSIEAYLLERVARARTGGQQSILLNTLYEKTGITDRRRHSDALLTVSEILRNWAEKGFIEGYSVEKTRIVIDVPLRKRTPGKGNGPKAKKTRKDA